MNRVAREQLGSDLEFPFLQLFFLSITSIPESVITDLGLIDCVDFVVVEPVVETR